MALRYLVTRMRTPAAAALRAPSVSLVSPAARYRRFCAPPRQDESHGKGILNVESAPLEDIMREAELLSKRSDEALARVWEYNEKIVPAVMQDFYKRVMFIVCAAGAAQLAEWAISPLKTTVGPPLKTTVEPPLKTSVGPSE